MPLAADLLRRLATAESHELARTEAQWAAALGASRSRLSRELRAATGRAFPEVRRWARLSRGAFLLRQTLTPIKAVAAASGYRSASQFCDECAALGGLSPRAFRALCTRAE
jgi:AraC-like DNA-binding protein